MTEILDFPERRDETAMGRFLLAVEQQENAQELALQQRRLTSQKPSIGESRIARTELDFIFSGPNKEAAERLYWRGLDDVVHKREPRVDVAARIEELRLYTKSLGVEILGAVCISNPGKHTPEALFYIHVERLTEVANFAYDTPRE